MGQGSLERIGVIGSGAWGTTLAIVAARAGHDVRLHVRQPDEARLIQETRENTRKLPGVAISRGITISSEIADIIEGAAVILLVVPSQSVRDNARSIAPFVRDAIIVSCAKGLERGSLLRMTDVIREELPESAARRVCALSGPNLSAEIAAGQPATTVIAGEDIATAERARDLLLAPGFRTYTNEDVKGVEIAGALKNVIAIGAGIADGMDAGDNAKAAFITRGIAEIARLGVALGANPLTFAGLAGIGDLIATCASPHSRNRHVGIELASGRALPDIQATMDHVAEGIFTTEAAVALGKRTGIELPIAEQLNEVLFAGKRPTDAIADLMRRDAKHELAGLFALSRD